MNLEVKVNIDEANLILFALENAPIALVKSAPLVNRLREEFTKQLTVKKNEETDPPF